MDFLIATNNPGKIEELRQLLADLPISLGGLSDIGIIDEVAETGATFAENAAMKAAGYSRIAGIPALADDSGLVIDYLGGEPGVHSARYAGESANDDKRIAKVLREMRPAPAETRTARFVCVAAIADGTGNVLHSAEGVCEGSIIHAPRGHGGFGYDPIFVPEGFDKTFGELPPEVKNMISHRGRAIAKIIPFLRGVFDYRT